MISYAISLGSIGQIMTSELESAFRRSKIKNVELSWTPYCNDQDPAGESAQRTARLITEGVIRPVSVHLPFYGTNGSYDPSALDESERKEVVQRFSELIERYANLRAPEFTLHASNEPPLEEHPRRIAQVIRSLEELMPLSEKYNFRINVEYLPRTCIGNRAEELQEIVRHFPSQRVGICMDVNHIMNRYRELPAIIDTLAPRINCFHISDYDGVDEMHWYPGQGLIDWPAVMKSIRAIDHDVKLIFETQFQLEKSWSHVADPYFTLRQTEAAAWYLENCETVIPAIEAFKLPGN